MIILGDIEASDYIKIKNCQIVSNIIDSLNIDYIMGKTWITDAFFRETRRNYLKRKEERCIAVEMELSACQAVVDFRGYKLYNFSYQADNLNEIKWESGILGNIH